MAGETREKRLTAAFVALADTLVAGYDMVDLLQTLVETCSDLLDASAAGLMLADGSGELSVVASTSEGSELVDLMQLRDGYNPSIECYETGSVVAVRDVAGLDGAHPDFRERVTSQGFHSLYVVPLRLRGTVIGSLSLFRDRVGDLSEEDAAVVQGLADVATIGILHERAVRESDVAQEQLQRALNSRVLIEQAKGVIAQVRGVDMDEAFRSMRAYARAHGVKLHEVAEKIVTREISI